MPTRLLPIAAVILLALFLAQLFYASRLKSVTSDEPPHLAAGMSYLATGQIRANTQHPPLLKELSGLSLSLAGIRWPETPETLAINRGAPGLEWGVGNNILISNGVDRTLFWARLPFLFLAVLHGAILFLWGRQLFNTLAGLGALFLYVLDPNILAHAYLVTTDCGFAGLTILYFFTLWNYLRKPTWTLFACSGLTLGLAMCAKFSGVALLPLTALLAVAAWKWPLQPVSAPQPDAPAKPQSPNAPCPCGSGKKYRNCHGTKPLETKPSAGPNLIHRLAATAGLFAIAAVVSYAVYLFPQELFPYADGYSRIYADHTPGYQSYLAGKFAPEFRLYFAACYLLKEPLAGIILAAIGLVFLLRSKQTPLLAKLFLTIPPAVLFIGYSLKAANAGVRYIIPVLPFLFLIGGAALASLLESPQIWKRVAAGVLCLWLLIAAVGVSPDHLAYFNELACIGNPSRIGWDGGTACGPEWLEDSNLDWGQGLKQLKMWLDQHAGGRPIRFAYFGTIPPRAYGILFEKIDADDLALPPTRGLYVVSTHIAVRARQLPGGDWLRTKPTAVVGHSYYVFDIR